MEFIVGIVLGILITVFAYKIKIPRGTTFEIDKSQEDRDHYLLKFDIPIEEIEKKTVVRMYIEHKKPVA